MLFWQFFRYGAGLVLRKALAVAFLVNLAVAARAEPVEILALGDSLTAGYGLLEQDGFVPRMRDWLEERGLEVRLVNGGVSGDTTAGGLARLEWSLNPSTRGVIVALGGNDMLRGIPPETVRANLSGILENARAHDLAVLLVGMEAPGNYGPEYKQAFDAVYPELAKEYGTLFFPNFFEGLLEDGKRPADLGGLMQDDHIHPNAEGVKRIVAAMGPAVAELVARASD